MAASATVTENFGFGQTAASDEVDVKLTGVVLTSDGCCSKTNEYDRCSKTREKNMLCLSSDWALASGRETYLLFGDIPTLERFGRKRVSVSGVLEKEPVVQYGVRMIRRKLTVGSIESSELSEEAIEELVKQLKVVPWRDPENYCRSLCWNFAFTDPMVQILQAGSGAQGILLDHVNDQGIQDQIVMLLGGVGDEKAIWPIIQTLTDGDDGKRQSRKHKLDERGILLTTDAERPRQLG